MEIVDTQGYWETPMTKPKRIRRSYALLPENDAFLRKEKVRIDRSVNAIINRLIEQARKKGGVGKW